MTIPTPASSRTPFRARPELRDAPRVAVLATVAFLFLSVAGFASVGVSSAQAASAPTIGEPTVEKVTETTATITATIRPEEARTSVYVEYEGAFTAPVAVEAGEAEKTVSFPLAGLKPGTTYSYRVFASNAEGSVQSPEAASPPAHFKTVAAPPPHGEQPWWHVTAGARPTYLHGGTARDEVQELKVNATGGKCPGEPEAFSGCYVIEDKELPGAFNVTFVKFNASAAELTTALEQLYGAGDVEVTGGPAATGTGNLSGPISGRGNLSEGSATVEGFSVIEGTLAAGQAIEGEGVPAGTTVVEFDEETGTVTLSKPVELHGKPSAEKVVLTVPGTGSKVVEDVALTNGAFHSGEEILGGGLPAGTKIDKVEAGGTLILSQAATRTAHGVALSSPLAPYAVTFTGKLADRHVAPMVTSNNFDFGVITITLNEGKEKGTATVVEKTTGREDAQLDIAAADVGNGPAVGACVRVAAGTGRFTSSECSGTPQPGAGEWERSLEIVDRLPKGLRAVSVEGFGGLGPGKGFQVGTTSCFLEAPHGEEEGQLAVCLYEGSLPAFDQIEMLVGVVVEPGAGSAAREEQQVAITGGGAPSFHISRPLKFSGEETPFGIEQYELTAEEEGGSVDTQAGSHPFQSTTTIELNAGKFVPASESFTGQGEVALPALVKDLTLHWPAGLVGNPSPFPVCSLAQFLAKPLGGGNLCPDASAIGVSMVTYDEPETLGDVTETTPVFLLEPQLGEPARVGFLTPVGPVYIDSSVRNGEDYGITVHVENTTQVAGFFRDETTVWGVPGAAGHDLQRGFGCIEAARGAAGAECGSTNASNPPPFLSLPSSCPGSPLPSTITADSWTSRGMFTEPVGEPVAQIDGCGHLPFTPSLEVKTDGTAASSPTGIVTDTHVPQQESLNAEGLAEGDVRDITVALPQGVTLNPADADGRQACSESQIGYEGEKELDPTAEPGVKTATFTPASPSCPAASKLANATITTPLLRGPLTGSVYLAAPQNTPGETEQNPFRSLVAMYIVAEEEKSGVLVKLPGQVSLNQTTGQITATFDDTPQVPFEDAKLEFFGGDRAPLATPARCGSYSASASFTPWSGGEPVPVASPPFNITTGPNGSACPGASLPFSPSLHSSSSNINAGGFTPLQTTISREDGQQDIQQVALHYPPGVSGLLAGVKLCGEQQANEGTCGPESLLGETIVSVGVGNDPYSVTGGKAYLTGPYHGAPFGLSIVNPAVAGPFDLGKVIVRAKIAVDPRTAQLTVTTNAPGEGFAIPHILDGIPLQIKHVSVNVNRPDFTFNPTSCAPMGITGTITGDEGAGSALETPFEVTNCRDLAFTPGIAVATAAKASRVDGASLHFKIAYPKGAIGSQSNFNEAKFDLPKQLPARLTTIQKACLAATFEANPAACPAHSLIGHAVVHTPVLPVPLEGPVYFVSYGGAKFPEAVLVLQGYGITVDLHGETFIDGKTGITSATFRNTPDVPFESIEVTIPQGPFSEFGANLPAKAHGSFCGQNLVMPTLFKAQNGLEIHQSTKISVTGCGKAKTRAQLLAAALRACHHKHGHKRASCEKAARRAYGARTVKHAKKGKH